MSLPLIIEIIQGVLRFPSQVLSLVRLLRGTPQEQHGKILERLEEEIHSFQETGRPTWSD